MTEDYRQNAADKPPILGREAETRKCVEVLSKKYKNNIVLVGQAGTGKSALVESLAKKLALGAVPSTLKNKELYEVDLQLLSAPNDDYGGPKKRLKQFIKEVEELNGDVILFIDEIHIIMGAESEGAMDIANTLKPTLASANGISLIGATTPYEFHKYMEKDAAITRRFTRINMDEPTPKQAKSILRGRRRSLEIFYGVTLSDQAIDLAVDLSVRYMPSRRLPDKAIDLLDQACASVRVSIDAMPPQLDLIQNQLAILNEELRTEKDNENKSKIEDKIAKIKPEFDQKYQLWSQQKQLLDQFTSFRVQLEDLRVKIEAEEAKEIRDTALLAQMESRYAANEAKLAQAKQAYYHAPEILIDDNVGETAIRLTIQSMTDIPLSEINTDERKRLKRLSSDLHKYVIGQEDAINAISYAIKNNRLGLGDPTQPIGSFLMLGPTGVGKAIADYELVPAIINGKEKVVPHGTLKVGDFVYDRLGNPTQVTGVYPQGDRQIYRVTMTDGRFVDVSDNHLWTVFNKVNGEFTLSNKAMKTHDLYINMVKGNDYYLPANGSIHYSSAKTETDFYKVGQWVCDSGISTKSYWRMMNEESLSDKYIPMRYITGDESQRWELIRGVFDTVGSIAHENILKAEFLDGGVAEQIASILGSLGYGVDVVHTALIHEIYVQIQVRDYAKFVSHPEHHPLFSLINKDDKEFSYCKIESVRQLGRVTPMTCIMVKGKEHLYQLANGMVTHNTELVKALAKVMFGDPKAMKRFDMGEFKSESYVARVIGAPPGEDKENIGGELTEWAKTKPYSIILFDEAEKAHPAIFDVMLSLLDDGELTDSRGEIVDFTNTVIILTSNIGAHNIIRGLDKNTGKLKKKTIDEVDAMLRNPDRENGGKGFKPEFLNRIDSITMFLPLKRHEIAQIADIKLNLLRNRLFKSRKIKLVYSQKIPLSFDKSREPKLDVSYWLSQQYTHEDFAFGGRPLERYIQTELQNKLTDMLLEEDVPDGACIYIRAKYPPGSKTFVDDDGLEKPTKPILDISQITESEYQQLIEFDPIYNK